MKREPLLVLIAETGYNVGYGAKKHFATYDIIEKLPGWVAFFSAAAAVLALFVPAFEEKWVSAAFLIISIGTGNILLYDRDKSKYCEAGEALTERFHELRLLYQAVKAEPVGTDLPARATEHAAIQAKALTAKVSRQIFLSDWYAHYKFFWQSQTSWMNEQLHFKLIRDKLPLGLTLTLLVATVFLGWIAIFRLPFIAAVFCKAAS